MDIFRFEFLLFLWFGFRVWDDEAINLSSCFNYGWCFFFPDFASDGFGALFDMSIYSGREEETVIFLEFLESDSLRLLGN